MANELVLYLTINFAKSGATIHKTVNLSVDVSSGHFNHNTQTVGTSEEELSQGSDLGSPGYVFIKNTDDTNYVEIGSTTGVYDIKLLPGEFCLYRHNSANIYAKADTASCDVEYIVIGT